MCIGELFFCTYFIHISQLQLDNTMIFPFSENNNGDVEKGVCHGVYSSD